MERLKTTRELHMKCDICGKEETLKEQPFKDLDCLNYGWSELDWLRTSFVFGRRHSKYHLCPDCTKKFDNKMLKEINLEEPGPTCE